MNRRIVTLSWPVLAAGGVAVVARRLRALSRSGMWAATAIGPVFLSNGAAVAGSLAVFFVSGSVLSWLEARWRQEQRGIIAKGRERDVWQVLANGGVAAGVLLLRRKNDAIGESAAVGSLAAAAADTWATEVGILSRQRPRDALRSSLVEWGQSGGVTVAGLLASGVGAALMATTLVMLSDRRARFAWRGQRWLGIVLAGIGGSLVDSVLGASVQALYYCPVCDRLTESSRHRCGSATRITRGYAWATNDIVNVCATMAGAVLGALWELAIGLRYHVEEEGGSGYRERAAAR